MLPGLPRLLLALPTRRPTSVSGQLSLQAPGDSAMVRSPPRSLVCALAQSWLEPQVCVTAHQGHTELPCPVLCPDLGRDSVPSPSYRQGH